MRPSQGFPSVRSIAGPPCVPCLAVANLQGFLWTILSGRFRATNFSVLLQRGLCCALFRSCFFCAHSRSFIFNAICSKTFHRATLAEPFFGAYWAGLFPCAFYNRFFIEASLRFFEGFCLCSCHSGVHPERCCRGFSITRFHGRPLCVLFSSGIFRVLTRWVFSLELIRGSFFFRGSLPRFFPCANFQCLYCFAGAFPVRYFADFILCSPLQNVFVALFQRCLIRTLSLDHFPPAPSSGPFYARSSVGIFPVSAFDAAISVHCNAGALCVHSFAGANFWALFPCFFSCGPPQVLLPCTVSPDFFTITLSQGFFPCVFSPGKFRSLLRWSFRLAFYRCTLPTCHFSQRHPNGFPQRFLRGCFCRHIFLALLCNGFFRTPFWRDFFYLLFRRHSLFAHFWSDFPVG